MQKQTEKHLQLSVWLEMNENVGRKRKLVPERITKARKGHITVVDLVYGDF